MKIKEIKSFSENLNLTKPYTIAYKTISKIENVFLLIILENGIMGIGSANPDFEVVGESPTHTLNNCLSEFCQSFVGKDIRKFRSIIREIHTFFPNKPGTQAIWDIALHDAFAKHIGVPVVDLYGQHIKSLPTSVTIGITNVDDTLKEASEYKKLGFKVLKIKTGQSVDIDIERIIKLHERYSDLIIRIDANQGYDPDDLLKFIRATKDCNLQLIEQPFPVGKEMELSNLDKDVMEILVADESLKKSSSALKFATFPLLFGNYNIKLMKCGGLLGAFEIAVIAKAAGINLFWGCNDESIVSITAALHAAFACQNTKYIDLDGSFDLVEEMVHGGFILEKGMLKISKKNGFGIELSEAIL